MARRLPERLVEFCRVLRGSGVPVPIEGSVSGARALDAVDLLDREDVRLALRSTLVSRREDQPRFDLLFDEYWPTDGDAASAAGAKGGSARTRVTRREPAAVRATTLDTWMRAPEESGETPVSLRAPSARESLGSGDFAGFDDARAAEFRRVARRLARRLALRKSRRWRAKDRGERLDPRGTARRALRTGGDPVELVRRTRRTRRTKLVVICDVSGSMEVYARFLLQFLHALQNSIAHVETFVFSTRLTRVTGELKGSDWANALDGIARGVHDWSGGTRIGESLADFVARWIALVDRRTAVLVLSDGWETGDPEILAAAMAVIHARAARVIWLNPLMGSADFTPEARGIRAVLPHIDLLLPAHNLAALEVVARELVRIRGRRR
jgi:uncharacterized protein with von Willebrand factor type A (vWA) domain